MKIIIFLILNFSALAIGSFFTKKEVASNWYQSLDKAPWTPPGWVFGAAWTFIMICFAFYMAYAWKKTDHKTLLLVLFGFQWILNVIWNPLFFKFHFVFAGLVVITALTLLIGFILLKYYSTLQYKSLLIAPYLIWLLIATSLNAYILVKN